MMREGDDEVADELKGNTEWMFKTFNNSLKSSTMSAVSS